MKKPGFKTGALHILTLALVFWGSSPIWCEVAMAKPVEAPPAIVKAVEVKEVIPEGRLRAALVSPVGPRVAPPQEGSPPAPKKENPRGRNCH